MMKLRTASFSLIFLLSGFAPALSQGSPPEPTEPPSRLSMFVHDVTDWVDHITTDAKQIITGADHISTDDHTATDADHVSSSAERHRTTSFPAIAATATAEIGVRRRLEPRTVGICTRTCHVEEGNAHACSDKGLRTPTMVAGRDVGRPL